MHDRTADDDDAQSTLVLVVSSSDALFRDLRQLLDHVRDGVHIDAPPAPRDNGRSSPLTPREREVLRLVAKGRSNHQIAQSLWVSQDTVRFHLRNAYRKLGVHNRRAAVAASALAEPVKSAD